MEIHELGIAQADEWQNPETLALIIDDVWDLLTDTETVQYIAVQGRKIPTMRKAAVILTDQRIILFQPQLVGGFNFLDFQWKDVQDIHLDQGMVAANFRVRSVNGRVGVAQWIDKAQGRRAYSIGQRYEQEWRERRRIRIMEENRSRAGGVVVGHSAPASETGQQVNGDPVERLSRAKTLLDQGLISHQEFEDLKQKILAGI